ncbi:LmbE family protein [Candidatus Omnitrophus magneticus]|uniref:LmbE family protein n=1 Tax=Candidatus Omnitrophus magneticus TaxID=1609969 RepID=A0A0F0CSF0_9BACT|nr:LmbE family protein [Candidatus Omnitrophus magneticus]
MRTLIISPHPDDETLGAGGTILKHKAMGAEVFWLNITDMDEKFGFLKDKVDARQKEISIVRAILDFDGFVNFSLKPAGLDQLPRGFLVEMIGECLEEIKPDTIFIPFHNDAHSDHKIVFESAFSASKIFRRAHIKKIFMMEILSETNFSSETGQSFSPNYYVDISEHFDKKIEILKQYKGEIAEHPFPRSEESVRSLAILRGSEAGCKYAEAYRAVKIIE